MTRPRQVVIERCLLAVFACILLLHLFRRPSAPERLEFLNYSDIYRHLRYAWESTRLGPHIYDTTLGGLPQLGDSRAFIWSNITYFYPPGAILLYMPASQLAYRGIISIETAANIMLFVFGMSAAFAGLRVWRHGSQISPTFEGKALWLVFSVCLFTSALGWGLRGEYDAVAIAVLVVAGTRKTPSQRLVWLAIAFFLRFQSLICLPFFALDLLALFQVRRFRVLRSPAGLVSLALTAITLAAAMYLAATGQLSAIKQSPLHLKDIPRDHLTLVCVLFTASFAYLSAARGRLDAAASAIWIFLAFASQSVVQGWYGLFIYVPVLFVSRRSQPWVATYALGFIYLLHMMPFVYYDEIAALFVLHPFYAP